MIKKIFKKFPFFVILLSLAGNLFAEDSPAAEKEFNLFGSQEVFAMSPVTDGILFGSGVLLSGGSLFTKNILKLNRQEYDGRTYDKDDVNSFDRIFMNQYSKTKDTVADVFLAGVLASPAVLLATDKSEWFTCAVMYAETLMISNGIKEMVKLMVDRPRPYMYYDAGTYPEDVSKDGDWCDSFPSGHSTMVFASATFTSYTFCKYFPESYWRIPVVAGSYALAVSTAALRIMSGNHFMTDVVSGAILGSAVGFFVPWLHTFNTKHDLNVGLLSNGVSISLRF